MKDFLFKSPTKVKFGAGISFQLYEIFEEMGAKKPFFVTGKHVGKTDEFAKIIASLEEKGYSVQLFIDLTTLFQFCHAFPKRLVIRLRRILIIVGTVHLYGSQ